MAEEYTHLGRIFHVTEEYEDIVDAVLTKGRQLTGSDRWLFESADYEVHGGSILERHEILSPDGVPESLRADTLRMAFPGIEREKLVSYTMLMRDAGFTYSAAIRYFHRQVHYQGIDTVVRWLEQIAPELRACEPATDDLESIATDSEAERVGMPTYGYHRVSTVYHQPEERTWFDKQPHLVQRLLTTPARCTNLNQLRKLGKGCYEADGARAPAEYQSVYRGMTNSQQAVFWSNYNSRKEALLKSVPLRRTAQALLKRIQNASSRELRGLGRQLYNLQNGTCRVRDPPKGYEWDRLWYHYRKRRDGSG